MRKSNMINRGHFIVFFMMIAFVVTCNFLLFFSYMDVDAMSASRPAILTFGNVLFLSLLFCGVETLWRKWLIDRPIRRINEGIERVMKGDFSSHIKYIHGEDSGNDFDRIIFGLNKMIDELSGVETLRNDFIANVSHELKTPLSVMQNYGVLLQNPDLGEEERVEYGKAIQEQTIRLSMLVTNILKLNKLENQQIYPKAEPYDLGEQLCESMLFFEAMWEEKQIEPEVNIDEDVLIEADKELLSLVWHNLLSNAIKFTEPGGKVSLYVHQDMEYAYVEVADTGCGMNAETGKNIFKKFYQGDTSHATAGNGLGLALVKRVVDICKGEISVSSKLGEGSRFLIKLPLKR